MSSNEKKQTANFGSRFGYIMVAAGAAIGLGNIWKFPYLAYGGGGGAFVVVYIIKCIKNHIIIYEFKASVLWRKSRVIKSVFVIACFWRKSLLFLL